MEAPGPRSRGSGASTVGGRYFRHARRGHGREGLRHGQPRADMGSHLDLCINDASGVKTKAPQGVRAGIGRVKHVRGSDAGEPGGGEPPRRLSGGRCGHERGRTRAAVSIPDAPAPSRKRRHVRRTADGRPARRLQSCRTRGAAGATPVAERVGGRNGGDEACGAVDGRRLGYSGAVPPRLTRGEHRTCWTSRRSTTLGYG